MLTHWDKLDLRYQEGERMEVLHAAKSSFEQMFLLFSHAGIPVAQEGSNLAVEEIHFQPFV